MFLDVERPLLLGNVLFNRGFKIINHLCLFAGGNSGFFYKYELGECTFTEIHEESQGHGEN